MMLRKKWLWAVLLALPLVGGGVVYGLSAKGNRAPASAGYVCPLTGEELSCPDCCPLNKRK